MRLGNYQFWPAFYSVIGNAVDFDHLKDRFSSIFGYNYIDSWSEKGRAGWKLNQDRARRVPMERKRRNTTKLRRHWILASAISVSPRAKVRRLYIYIHETCNLGIMTTFSPLGVFTDIYLQPRSLISCASARAIYLTVCRLACLRKSAFLLFV